jgi:hypothetical protein
MFNEKRIVGLAAILATLFFSSSLVFAESQASVTRDPRSEEVTEVQKTFGIAPTRVVETFSPRSNACCRRYYDKTGALIGIFQEIKGDEGRALSGGRFASWFDKNGRDIREARGGDEPKQPSASTIVTQSVVETSRTTLGLGKVKSPYSIQWHTGGPAGATFTLLGVSLGKVPAPSFSADGPRADRVPPGQPMYALTLHLKIRMDDAQDQWGQNPTARLTLRRILNDEGDAVAPYNPQIFLPDSGGSSGLPACTYTHDILFRVPENDREFLIATRADSKLVFRVSFSANGGAKVEKVSGR